MQLGIPRVTITRMVVNVGIEALGGAMPFLGAIFDTVFKANKRNYQLLKVHVSRDRRQTARDWLFLIVAILLVAAGVALPVMVLIYLARHI